MSILLSEHLPVGFPLGHPRTAQNEEGLVGILALLQGLFQIHLRAFLHCNKGNLKDCEALTRYPSMLV